MTKPIVGVAMMMLWEQGKWTLDDPVAEAHPGVRRPQGGHAERRGAAGHADDDAAADEPHGRLRRQRRDTRSSISGSRSAAQAMIDKLAKLPLAAQPGTDWRYGPSVDIQGYIVEKLSGQPLDVFLRTKIFEPLGMKDTGFWVDAVEGRSRHRDLHLRSGQAHHRATAPAARATRHVEAGVPVRQRRAALHDRRLLQVRADGAERRRGQRQAVPESVNRGADADQRARRRRRGRYATARPQPGIGFGLDFAIVMDPAAANTPEGEAPSTGAARSAPGSGSIRSNDVVVVGMIQNVDGSSPTGGSPQVRPLSRQAGVSGAGGSQN